MLLSFVILDVINLDVTMLSVAMLNVIMLRVLVPQIILLCRKNTLAYFVQLQVKKSKVLDIFDARTAGTRCGTRRRESWRARLKSWCPCYKTIFPSCFKVGNERTGWQSVAVFTTLHFLPNLWMDHHDLKNVNNCLNINIYSYLKTSGGQSSNLCLNVVPFFNTSVN